MNNSSPTPRMDFVRGTPQGNSFAKRSLCVMCGVGIFVIVALVQLGENGFLAFTQLRVRADELQREVADLETGNEELRGRTEAIRTDPEALEKFAREKYNMRRPDEEVLVFVPIAETEH